MSEHPEIAQPDHEIESLELTPDIPPRPEEELADAIRLDAPAIPQPHHH